MSGISRTNHELLTLIKMTVVHINSVLINNMTDFQAYKYLTTI